MTQAIEWVTYVGAPLYDEDGNLIGTIEEFFVETDDGPPAWVVILSEADDSDAATRSYVPMVGTRRAEDGQGLQVSVDGDAVREAPTAQHGDDLSGEEERRLYEHYGQPYPSTESAGEGTADEESSDRSGDTSRRPGLLRRLLHPRRRSAR